MPGGRRRERDLDGDPSAGQCEGADRSAMRRGDGADDGETQTVPGAVVDATRVQTLERLEEAIDLGRGNDRPGVGDWRRGTRGAEGPRRPAPTPHLPRSERRKQPAASTCRYRTRQLRTGASRPRRRSSGTPSAYGPTVSPPSPIPPGSPAANGASTSLGRWTRQARPSRLPTRSARAAPTEESSPAVGARAARETKHGDAEGSGAAACAARGETLTQRPRAYKDVRLRSRPAG